MTHSFFKLFLMFFSLIFSTLSYSASFDCSKASSPFEKTICGNSTLSSLDDQLAAAYKTAKANSSNPEQLWAEEVVWIKSARTCGVDVACIQQAYNSRIAALKPNIAGGGQALQPTPQQAESVAQPAKEADKKPISAISNPALTAKQSTEPQTVATETKPIESTSPGVYIYLLIGAGLILMGGIVFAMTKKRKDESTPDDKELPMKKRNESQEQENTLTQKAKDLELEQLKLKEAEREFKEKELLAARNEQALKDAAEAEANALQKKAENELATAQALDEAALLKLQAEEELAKTNALRDKYVNPKVIDLNLFSGTPLIRDLKNSTFSTLVNKVKCNKLITFAIIGTLLTVIFFSFGKFNEYLNKKNVEKYFDIGICSTFLQWKLQNNLQISEKEKESLRPYIDVVQKNIDETELKCSNNYTGDCFFKAFPDQKDYTLAVSRMTGYLTLTNPQSQSSLMETVERYTNICSKSY